MSMQLYPHISADAGVLSGQPVVEGTTVPVSLLVKQIATGKSVEDVAREHGVSVEDVCAALEYAAQRVLEPVSTGMPRTDAGSVGAEVEVAPAEVEAEARRVGLDPTHLSPLVRRLLELRVQAAAAGERFLTTREELDAEIADRRGGIYPYPDVDE